MKFSSLAALGVVKMTTSSAASDENFVKMTFSFSVYPAACALRHVPFMAETQYSTHTPP